MKDVYTGMIFYNDYPLALLEKSLKALHDLNIKIIAVDGAYQNFPLSDNETVYSFADVMAIVRKYATLIIPCPEKGWKTQREKRNAYLQACPLNHYLIVIDTDEIIECPDIDFFRFLTEDVYKLKEYRYTSSGIFKRMEGIRIYRIYSDLRYAYQHCRIYRLNKHNPKDLESGLVTQAHGDVNSQRTLLPITIHHYNYLRPEDRRTAKTKFYAEREEKKYGY